MASSLNGKLTKHQVEKCDVENWLTKWQVDKMASSLNGKLTIWQVDKMMSWENDCMRKQPVDKMAI